MDEKTLRYQCLQQANSMLAQRGGMMPGSSSVFATPEEVLTLADKLYKWVISGAAA